ncbi:MAG: toxin HipA [Marinilabiliales bacterium]|nr:MAG: toxin HipA [Marinilabiliales bacterium]
MVEVAVVRAWGINVGAVRWNRNLDVAEFQYDPLYFENGWQLSPLKMPATADRRVFRFPELRAREAFESDTFKGLPGLLADSLPDRYGNRLMNIWLLKHQRPEDSMNPVEQLCFIGNRGMGALEFEPAFPKASQSSFSLEVDGLVDIAHQILNSRNAFYTNLKADEESALQQILKIGTSAGGARPKAVIAYDPESGDVRSGQGIAPEGYEHWLIKLDGVSNAQFGDTKGWGRVEYAYYLMAGECGIEMTECRLLEENQRAHFMTKRFDREGSDIKHHIQTLCALQHYDFNEMFAFGYEQVFQTMRQLKLSYPEAEQMFRRMVFNVLATNCDDHTKNFAFRLKKDGRWELAPAYDLCFAYDQSNKWVSRQTLSVNSKRENIMADDLMTIAKANNIKNGERIISEINSIVKNWGDFANIASVSNNLKDHIHRNLHTL